MGLFDSFKTDSQPKPLQTQPNKSVTQTNPNPFLGIGYSGGGLNPTTVFYVDGITINGKAYRYNELGEISIDSMPNGIAPGIAQVLHKSTMKYLRISFVSASEGYFMQAVDFANKKIHSINGSITDSRKFILRCSDNAIVEVYEDYLSIRRLKKSLGSSSNQGTEFIQFSNLVKIIPGNANNVTFQYQDDENKLIQSTIYVFPQTATTVNDILHFARNYKVIENSNDDLETPIVGEAREFFLMGETIKFSTDMDLYTDYRREFIYKSKELADCFRKEYDRKIHDFDSFMYFYPKIYSVYLKRITKKATDILVANGVWTETQDSLTARHTEKNQLALEDYMAMVKSALLTAQKNTQQMQALTSLVPNLVGGGFGVAGAVKGIATATAYNLVRDAAVSSAISNATNISETQKAELYARIKIDTLINRVFSDFWNVYLTLCNILKENGKDVWIPTDDLRQKGNNVLQNILNPNFPKEQLPKVMTQIISEFPYNRKIYDYLDEIAENKEEVTLLREYIGYTSKTPQFIL